MLMLVGRSSVSVGRNLRLAAVLALVWTGCGGSDAAEDTKPAQVGGRSSGATEGSGKARGGETDRLTAATASANTGGAGHSREGTSPNLSCGSWAVGSPGKALLGGGGQSNVGAESSANGDTTSAPNSTGGVGLASVGGSLGKGGFPSAGGSATRPLGNRDILKPVAKEFCSAAASCCRKDGLFVELEDCESAYLERQPAAAYIERGTVTVNATTLSGCIAAYQDASTQCTVQKVIEACQDLFVGTQQEGQACANGYECSKDKGPSVCLFHGSN